MKINSDFRDLLRNLNAAGVRYLIVGGYAMMVHTEPRYTKDLDLWVEPVESNAQKLFSALAEFGAPTKDIHPRDFTEHHDVRYRTRFCRSLGAQSDRRLWWGTSSRTLP